MKTAGYRLVIKPVIFTHATDHPLIIVSTLVTDNFSDPISYKIESSLSGTIDQVAEKYATLTPSLPPTCGFLQFTVASWESAEILFIAGEYWRIIGDNVSEIEQYLLNSRLSRKHRLEDPQIADFARDFHDKILSQFGISPNQIITTYAINIPKFNLNEFPLIYHIGSPNLNLQFEIYSSPKSLEPLDSFQEPLPIPKIVPPPMSDPPSLNRGSRKRKKFITAHSMFETNLEPVRKIIKEANLEPNKIDGGGYIFAELYEEDIVKARDQPGVVVEELEDDLPITTPGAYVKKSARNIWIATSKRLKIGTEKTHATEDSEYHVVQFRGPMLEEWRVELDKLQINLLRYFPVNCYLCKLIRSQVSTVQKLIFISKVRKFVEEDKGVFLSYDTLSKISDLTGSNISRLSFGEKTFDIILHKNSDLQIVKNWFREKSITPLYANDRKIRIRLADHFDILLRVTKLEEVEELQEYVVPELSAYNTNAIIGIEKQVLDKVERLLPFSGKGQIIGIADVAVDEKHQDFKGKSYTLITKPGLNNIYSRDYDNHGTHIAGLVVGTGKASEGKFKGIAPEADMVFQSLKGLQKDIDLPADLSELYREAYSFNVRIHNNSWGMPTQSEVYNYSVEVDKFVHEYQDMLILFAAGNFRGKDEKLNLYQINEPGTAKNIITVGASDTRNPDLILSFSNNGPCHDCDRIKPDIIAPGFELLSTRSSATVQGTQNEVEIFTDNPEYAIMSGTSQATAIVSGCAILLRQYYLERHNINPSAALLKASLINSTKYLSTSDSIRGKSPPNGIQGFGRLDIRMAMPDLTSPELNLEFIDTWNQIHQQYRLQYSKDFRRFKIEVNGTHDLRICLVWTDIPGRSVQNQLVLLVSNDDQSIIWIGNGGARVANTYDNKQDSEFFRNLGFDRSNNVQVVRVNNPKSGYYYIKVLAYSLIDKNPQDFALVIMGNLNGPVTEYLGN